MKNRLAKPSEKGGEGACAQEAEVLGQNRELTADASTKMEAPTDQMYGIQRESLGWYVSLMRMGKRYSKFFSGPLLGGDELALAAAQKWRNAMVQAVPPQTRKQRSTKLRSSNTSGIAGVSCEYGQDGKPRLWIAKTSIGSGEVLRKTFGVRRYGAAAAFEMAVAERARQLLQMHGLAHVHEAEEAIRDGEPEQLPNLRPVTTREMIRRRNNSTGTPGVVPRGSPDGQVKYWIARTYVNGETWTDCFAVADHGDGGAKALAVAARQHQLEKKAAISPAQRKNLSKT